MSRKTIPKKSSQTKHAWVKLVVGGLIILTCIALFMRFYIEPRQEAANFAKLKQDFLTLQTEFNKIDQGWKYREGCRGTGSNRLYATSCNLEIYHSHDPNDIHPIGDYARKFIYNNKFLMENHANDYYRLRSTSFADAVCSFQPGMQENIEFYSLYCIANAKEFHFKRTDL